LAENDREVINGMRVGFYVENRGTGGIDIREPEYGNPGIGGSQFTTIALAYYQKKLFSDRIEPVLLINDPRLMPENLEVYQAEDCVQALELCREKEIDLFVFKSRGDAIGMELYDRLETAGIPSIARSNNTPSIEGLKRITKCEAVKRHVCVSQEQLDRLRDHRIFYKSTRIFNVFNTLHFRPTSPIDKSGKQVAYIGSLIHAKGFHVLARAWPQVLKEVPEAKLTVIGSGQLYDRSNKLGRWGVAEEWYEAKHIRPHLSDGNGGIHPSVHFAGILGKEKITILRQADVGVANPTGVSENCPASAIEIQACGTPIASAAEWGLLDTVDNGKTGLLSKNQKQFERNIVYLLTHREEARRMGERGVEFIDGKFAPTVIAREWFELFEEVLRGEKNRIQSIEQNPLYRGKLFRELLRIIKRWIPVFRIVPSVVEIREYLKKPVKKILGR
jgi:glycosyltransferase involved in cell wall biosynthesis